jgi:AcrR family transcriptional regulator
MVMPSHEALPPPSAVRPDRLAPDDWTRAALGAIASKGAGSVSVERLARELGTTKGSFYWHFKDRQALIDAALQWWERESTDRVIEQLSAVDDPRARFRALLESTFGDHPGVLIDANLVADASNPAVGAALERSARKRLAFVERIFAQIGTPAGSDRALLALSAFVGLAQLRRTAPMLTPKSRRAKTYIDNAVECFLGS